MKHIRELDGLRGLMAMWVVVGHILAAFPPLFGRVPNALWNSDPVHVFIILSGFVIFSLLDRGFESYGRYITGRAFRIFPVYLVVLVVSTASLNFAENVLRASPVGIATAGRIQIIEIAKNNLAAHIAAHVPLLQGLIPHEIFSYAAVTIVGQAWSLTVEWQFYLIAPLLFVIVTSLNRNWARASAVAIVAVCWLISPHIDAGFVGNNLPMFSAGFLSYFAYKHGLTRLSRKSRAIALASSVLLALIFAREYVVPLSIWLVSLFCVVSANGDGVKGLVSALLSSKIAKYLGTVSYPLYMVHMQVLFACMWLANAFDLSMVARIIVLPVCGIAASVAAADVLHRVVEAPFHEIGRRLSKPSLPRKGGLDVA
jgi:peptidoglycan/LPS O-acetylase OafA/YrhL